MRGKMDCYGLTDVGLKREINEDQFLIADLGKSMLIRQTSLNHEDHTRLFGGSQGKLLVVADGMGGHAAGERASSIAVQTLAHYLLNTMNWFLRLHESEEDDLIEELKAAMERCQQRLHDMGTGGGAANQAMGTTLTIAYIIWPRLYVVHAGDSRCYLLRTSRLEQITTDHTIAQQLVERGALTPEQAEGSRLSHMLWNCIGGGSAEVTPEVKKTTLVLGDSLLLCSDGLTKCLSDEQLKEMLQQDRGAEETCKAMVRTANAAGGPDNITVVVACFREASKVEAQATEQVVVTEPVSETTQVVQVEPVVKAEPVVARVRS